MLEISQIDSDLQIDSRHYLLPLLFLFVPPLLLIEYGSSLLDGSIDTSNLVGLVFGVVLPLVMAYFFIEFGRFRFSVSDGVFRWRWRNLLNQEQGEVPLDKVVRVRREGLEASDTAGLQSNYRLVVILDDGRVIGLTRGYSGLQDRKLDQIVDRVRDYLGHAAR